MGFIITLALFAVAFALNEITARQTDVENARPSELGDFQIPTATEQRKIPILWGTARIKGPNIVWYGDLRQDPITQTQKVSFFSKKTSVVGYKYSLGIQLALCRGGGFAPAAEQFQLLRFFVDEEVLFDGTQGEGEIAIDRPMLFGGDDLGAGGMTGTLYVRVGTETQTAPTYLEAFQQASNGDTPGYRGTAYLVWNGTVGNRTSLPPWSAEGRRIPNGLGLASPTVNGGNDANPMNCMFEIITNDEWGYGFGSADVDTAAFAAAAEVLRLEGNGISWVWDSERDVREIVREIERQIDGVVFIDRSTGKWTVSLARAGYDIDDVPQITDDDLIEMRDFKRAAWEDTSNSVQVSFSHRGRDYQGTYAPAIDHGNIFIQGGQIKDVAVSYPMVKDPSLANDIAWRELRTLSTPLLAVKLVVDRSYYEINPGDVVAWTNESLGFTKLAMRVTRVDLGDLSSNRITLDLVEDVFRFDDGSFVAPDNGDWEPPVDTLVAFPTDESLAFEAPRAFLRIDPDNTNGLSIQRVWAGGRNQGDGATAINILDDVLGPYTLGGEAFGFLVAGELNSALGKATNTDGVSNDTVSLTATPSNQLAILGAAQNATDTDIGSSLLNIAIVGDEIIGFRSASANGALVDLETVYRGLLDTPQQEHDAGTPVYLLTNGGNMTDRLYDVGSVNIKLQPISATDTLAEASAPAIAVTLDDRSRRPYLPSRYELNGDYWPTSRSLDSTFPGSGIDSVGLRLDLTRRDYRLTDEVAALIEDAETTDPTFPAANTTQYLVEVVEDPDGVPTSLFTTSAAAGPMIDITRTSILAANGGVVPSRIELRLRSRHQDGGTTLDSTYTLDHAFGTTSGLSGLAALGALDTDDVSASFVAGSTGNYGFTVGTALPAGAVEARLNGGSWVAVIAATTTSGTLTGVTSGDTVEIRHRDATPGIETTCLIADPTATNEAFAVLVT